MSSLHWQSVPPEIFAAICVDCNPHTLSSLALTCRGLSWLALAMLWQRIDSLSTLLFTLPLDAVVRRVPYVRYLTGKLIRVVNVRRELTSADLERYRLYAPLVHSLNLFGPLPLGCDITLDGWQHFERANPGPLPNLRHLDANIRIDRRNPYRLIIPINISLGAAFEDLTLSVRTPLGWNPQPDRLKPYISDLLTTLVQRCPRFSRLDLSLDQAAPYLSDVLADALRGMPRLVTP
ncbi:hypothetical protein NUW54_g8964 [Trametes sanguinea]|uniref:Uncharacterized protein n=1 Tax=Trametes sanguinea TaxID=158606 RepID=A0ACC1PCM1_9APHY|nr:hypothetical protein NUW54_g8964 [Trametes sanguinea]